MMCIILNDSLRCLQVSVQGMYGFQAVYHEQAESKSR